jgi:hypothetical protein
MEPSAVGFYNQAYSYWKAGDALRSANLQTPMAEMPIKFLYYQAIEVLLKSFLLANGYTISTIRNDFGHHVHQLLLECNRHGLVLNEANADVIRYIDEANEGMEARSHRNRLLPNYDLVSALRDTIAELREIVCNHLIEKGPVGTRLRETLRD